MTYEEIFNLKFREGLPTHIMEKRYPKDKLKITRVALSELPEESLRTVIRKDCELEKILYLKRYFRS
nr:hypothetical protein JG2_0170 [uncultured bacterium]